MPFYIKDIRHSILRISLLLLFAVAGAVCAQAQDIYRDHTLDVDFHLDDAQDTGTFYESKVTVYAFATEKDAKTALELLTQTYGQDRPKYVTNTTKPNEKGYFRIQVDNDGFLLIWFKDISKYKPRIINVYETQNGQKITIEKDTSAEKKKNGDFTKDENDGHLKIDEVEINAKTISRARADINTSKEVNGVVTSRMDFMVPYRTSTNIRVVVQPMWYDRVEFSDEGSDTVFSYGKCFYHDKIEYKFTQKRRMAFNLMNDSLYRYNTQIAGERIYDYKNGDSICSHISFTPKNDSIHVYIVDTVSGFSPDYSHPYPFGAVVDVYDYNAKVYSTQKRGYGERKVPLKFLDFSFKEFLPNPADFMVTLEDRPQESNAIVKLNFENGKDYINPADSVNIAELNRVRADVLKFADEKYELIWIKAIGVASPEGGVESNKSLARRRAAFLANEIRKYTGDRQVKTDESFVAPWEEVADTLEQNGHLEKAAEIRAICEKYPGNIDVQYNHIRTLAYYNTLLKDSVLPQLRTVRYIAKFNEVRQLSPAEVIAKYNSNKSHRFSRGEFWSLFENLKDPIERERVARHALTATRRSNRQYNDGYWAYAACLLACQYIARDTADLNILKPFLDLNYVVDTIRVGDTLPDRDVIVALNDTIIERNGVLDTIQAGFELPARIILADKDTIIRSVGVKDIKRDDDSKDVLKYTNSPEIAANQLIMSLRQKNRAKNKDIPVLEAITGNGGAKYDTLLYFSKCLRGGYQAGGEFSENEAAHIRNVVSATSPTNSVIIKLAMEDEDNLKAAATVAENLPDNAVSDYLNAIIKFRQAKEGDKTASSASLARSFVRNVKMIPIACNDEDFISPTDNGKNTVTGVALNMWKDSMRTVVTIVDNAPQAPVDSLADTMDVEPKYNEKHPFTWYIRALDAAVANTPEKDEEAKQALFKCFNIDHQYKDVLNVSMLKDLSIKDKTELKEKLKGFRDEYNKQSKKK